MAVKVSESLVDLVEALLRDGDGGTGPGSLAPEAFEMFSRRVDYSGYGGAPLLGVGGPCVVGHGRSSARAVRNAIVMAHRFAQDGLVPRIEAGLADLRGGTS